MKIPYHNVHEYGATLLIFMIVILCALSCRQAEVVPPSVAPIPYKEVVMDGLAHPWSIAFIDKDEALITEKDGDLLLVNLSNKSRRITRGFPKDLFTAPLIDVDAYPSGTYPTSLDGKTIRGNGGILEVILHPEFKTNSRVFISYVSEKEETYALKVISARIANDSLTDIKIILNPGPYVPGIWHFGGGMCILDDYLYITVGERLFYEHLKQGLPIAQDVSDARGGIYRLLLDGSIPPDNPDLGPNATPGMYAFGIRAAQGITVRPGTKEIWFSEHGTNQGDEVNLLRDGANYGWPNITSGTWRSKGYEPDSLDNPIYTDPLHYWLQTVAPTGLAFYDGQEFPSWRSNLIVPGLSRGSLWRLVLDGQTVVSAEELFLGDHVRSRKIAQGHDGHLYQLTDEDNGKLIRIINKSKK